MNPHNWEIRWAILARSHVAFGEINMTSEKALPIEEVKDKKTQYKMILDALGDAIHVVDRNLVIIYQNSAFSDWLKSLNLNPNLIGKHLSEAFPFISNETIDEYRSVFTTGTNHIVIESTLINGREIFTEARKIPVIEKDEVIQIITLLRDITQQRKSEERIRESEKRYRKLYDNLSDALFQTDINGKITMAGERAKAIFGYEEDELIGRHFTELLALHEKPRLIDAFRNRLTNLDENPEGIEAEGLRKDGSSFTFHITNSILYDGGNPVGYQSLVRDVTEMKKAQDEISQKEQMYRALFEQNNDAVFILDVKGDVYELNRPAEELFGYTKDEMIGTPFRVLLSNLDEKFTQKVNSDLVSGKEIPVFEHEFVKKDGTIFPAEVRLSVIKDPEKEPIFAQAIVRNISERKKNEKTIREEHARSQKYLAIAGVMLIALNSKGQITLLNQKGCEILGYSEDEVLFKDWFSMMVPEDYQEITRNAFHLLMQGKGESVTKFENTVITKSGEIRLISWQNEVLRDKEGNITGTLSSGEDITERKRILDALRTERNRYQILFETAPIAIAVTTDDGEFVDANWSFQELLGYTLDELVHLPVRKVYANSAERERLTSELDKEGKVRNLETVLEKKNGEKIDALLNVDYVDYDDRIVRLTTIRDISEVNITRKKLEEGRARAEFYAELLAHDLNNVHQGILVGAELLLLDKDLGQSGKDHSIAIRDQVARGIDLIENVRKLSKMEAEASPEFIQVDLHGILMNALMLAQHAFPLKKANFDIRFESGQVIVRADEFLIDLFYNMIHNALKFDSSDVIEIAIEISKGKKAGYVEVAVIDKGPGIPPERKEELFSRLERGRTLGSGMGLTLVKHIAERYGGRTWVEDRVPGIHTKGSKFIVELPIVKDP